MSKFEFIAGVVIVVLIIAFYVRLRLRMMRNGYYYCSAPGCGILHPPDETETVERHSLIQEHAEDRMAARRYTMEGENSSS